MGHASNCFLRGDYDSPVAVSILSLSSRDGFLYLLVHAERNGVLEPLCIIVSAGEISLFLAGHQLTDLIVSRVKRLA